MEMELSNSKLIILNVMMVIAGLLHIYFFVFAEVFSGASDQG